MKMLKLATILVLSFSFSSCNFKPIYNYSSKNEQNRHLEQDLASIKIEVRKKHLEQKFKNHLENALNPNNIENNNDYLLKVTLQKSVTSTFTTASGSSGRDRISLSAQYQLINTKSGAIIANGGTSAKDDYNVSDNRFANYTSREETFLNLTKIVANNLRDLIINDLNNKTDKIKSDTEI